MKFYTKNIKTGSFLVISDPLVRCPCYHKTSTRVSLKPVSKEKENVFFADSCLIIHCTSLRPISRGT